jgi:peptidyl-prolyl cis-trans isomerase C
MHRIDNLIRKGAVMARARARHILVPTAEKASDLKAQIAAGADFAELAQQHSTCPSGARGGDLGEFAPGQMVREFNDVCFNEEVGVVHGPVQTQFGYHLIEVTNRTE